jgi:hypothetical protein
MPLPVARSVAIAILAVTACATRGAACGSDEPCCCPSPDSLVSSPPLVPATIDFAFGFSKRTAAQGNGGFRISTGWGGLWNPRRPTSRMVEDELLDDLRAREAEVAAVSTTAVSALPMLGHDSQLREPLNVALSFSGPMDPASYHRPLADESEADRPRLDETPLLAELAAREELIAKELADPCGPQWSPEELKAAGAYSGWRVNPAPRPVISGAHVVLSPVMNSDVSKDFEAMRRRIGVTTAAEWSDADEQGDERSFEFIRRPYSNWRDYAAVRFTVISAHGDRKPASTPRPAMSSLDFAFCFSAHCAENVAGSESGVPGEPACHERLWEDELLAELAAAEGQISDKLAVAAEIESTPPVEASPAPELYRRLPDESNFGWSGMMLASHGAADDTRTTAFKPLNGVAMRFPDDPPATFGGMTFSR